MRLDLLKALNEERIARRPAVLVTDTQSGTQRLVRGGEIETDPLGEQLADALRMGKSRSVEVEGRNLFLTVQAPPARILCVGAVHISQALAPMARQTDFDVIVLDPRTAFATPERFPNVELIAEWPDVAIPRIKLDHYTGVCLLTHDPKIDDPALIAALKANCFYIGALGSRKTHGNRVQRMREQGFKDEDLARIHAPIGLDIGSVSPAEIAVSILGEIIMALRKKPLRAEKVA
jgi:xanthine dehydrogenase accessory factor